MTIIDIFGTTNDVEETPGGRFYDDDRYPRAAATGRPFSVNSTQEGAIDAMVGFLLNQIPAQGVGTKIFKTVAGEGFTEAAIRSVEIEINSGNEIRIGNEVDFRPLTEEVALDIIGATGVQAGAKYFGLAIGSSGAGFVAGTLVEFASTLYDFVNDVITGEFRVDARFYDATGDHNIGIYFPNGQGLNADSEIVEALLNRAAARGEPLFSANINNNAEIVVRFDDFAPIGTNTYKIYNAQTSINAIKNALEITEAELTEAGNNEIQFVKIPLIGQVAYLLEGILNSTAEIAIPITVGGGAQLVTVNNIYDGSISSENLKIGFGDSIAFEEVGLVTNISFSSQLVGDSDKNLILSDSQSHDIIAGGDNDTIIGGGGDDTINPGDGQNIIDGGDGIDTISFAGFSSGIGINLNEGGTTTTSGDKDTLYNIENIIAGAYNDSIFGSGADNVIDGGSGDDAIDGLGGHDTFRFTGSMFGDDNVSGGEDIIINGDLVKGRARLVSSNNYSLDGYDITETGGGLKITGGAGSVFLSDWDGDDDALNYGITLEEDDPLDPNQPPVVENPNPDFVIPVGKPFTYFIPTNTFDDPDNDSLDYSVITAGDIPGFGVDVQTLTVGGTPEALGFFSIALTADDGNGGQATDIFNVEVINNDPVLVNPIDQQVFIKNQSNSFTIPSDTFDDIDGHNLSYTVTFNQVDQDGTFFDNHNLTFNPATNRISGIPTESGELVVNITADDGWGGTAEHEFALTVNDHSPDFVWVKYSHIVDSASYDIRSLDRIANLDTTYTYIQERHEAED